MKEICSLFLISIGIFTTEAKAEEKLKCDHSNYREYIYDDEKTQKLLKQTRKGCQLEGVDLRRADLSKANFMGANLIEADLRGAYLIEANLKGADLKEAHLYKADLRGAYLMKTNFYKADLKRVNFTGAYTLRTNFIMANLKEANFKETDLKGADLKGADLKGADLRKANLTKADLKGADLTKADLKGANIRLAKYDDNTVFPEFFINSDNHPCPPRELTFWEEFVRYVGIKGDSLAGEAGEQQCSSSIAINDSDRSSKEEESAGKNNNWNLDKRGGVLR